MQKPERPALQEPMSDPLQELQKVLVSNMRSRTPHPSCRDLAERLGLIGAAKGMPADLSTNPEHMEGFGHG
jgi:hypothetical protein